MGGTSFDPRGANPAGVAPQQGGSATKPSLWDTWVQRAYSLRPLGNSLQQTGNSFGQRSLNMLHGDGFRTDTQVYPAPPPPQAFAARPPSNPPVRGGVPAVSGQQGGVQGPPPNILRQPAPGQVAVGGPATVGGHRLSPQALQWIGQCEGGYKEKVYDRDGNDTKNCTVGYGHLVHAGPCGVNPKQVPLEYPRTPAQAENELMHDAREHEDWVNQNVREPLTQNQFDALTSLHFNTKDFIKHDVWAHDLQDPAHANLSNVPDDMKTLVRGRGGLPYRRDGEANMWNGVYPDLSDPDVCDIHRKVPLKKP